ncbi:hypothetical protein D1007_12888 [Hordeum vulgare]|nr:hypothetical protein D1007_12888 [Hordeum vulgare]
MYNMEHRYDEPEGINNVRKRLVLVDGMLNIRGQSLPNLVGKVGSTMLMIEGDNSSSNQDPSTTPGKMSIVKQRRQDGKEELMDVAGTETHMMNVAVSREEDHRIH